MLLTVMDACAALRAQLTCLLIDIRIQISHKEICAHVQLPLVRGCFVDSDGLGIHLHHVQHLDSLQDNTEARVIRSCRSYGQGRMQLWLAQATDVLRQGCSCELTSGPKWMLARCVGTHIICVLLAAVLNEAIALVGACDPVLGKVYVHCSQRHIVRLTAA